MTVVKTKRTAFAFALLLCLSFAGPTAMADVEGPDIRFSDINKAVRGNWTFQTPPYRSGNCSMSGTLTVFGQSKTKKDALNCELIAVEVCHGLRSKVEQECSVSVRDNLLKIDSTIVNFLESKGLSTGYAPDNFSLNEVKKDIMKGYLDSAVIAPVVFQREFGGIS